MPKRVVVGVVTSDKQDKTRRVEISRLEKHPKYGNSFVARPSAPHTMRTTSLTLVIRLKSKNVLRNPK